LKSDVRMRRCPISEKVKNGGRSGKRVLTIIRGNSGPTPVAHGGSRAKAHPLSSCPYWQVVNRSLLRLLSTNLSAYYRLALNYNIKNV